MRKVILAILIILIIGSGFILSPQTSAQEAVSTVSGVPATSRTFLQLLEAVSGRKAGEESTALLQGVAAIARDVNGFAIKRDDHCVVKLGSDTKIGASVGGDQVESGAVLESNAERVRGSVVSEPVLPGIEQLTEKFGKEKTRKIVEAFISESQANIATLREACEQNDSLLAYEIAHKIKGACSTSEASEIRNVCLSLEQLSRDGRLDECTRWHRVLLVSFEQFKKQVEELLN